MLDPARDITVVLLFLGLADPPSRAVPTAYLRRDRLLARHERRSPTRTRGLPAHPPNPAAAGGRRSGTRPAAARRRAAARGAGPAGGGEFGLLPAHGAGPRRTPLRTGPRRPGPRPRLLGRGDPPPARPRRRRTHPGPPAAFVRAGGGTGHHATAAARHDRARSGRGPFPGRAGLEPARRRPVGRLHPAAPEGAEHAGTVPAPAGRPDLPEPGGHRRRADRDAAYPGRRRSRQPARRRTGG